MSWEDINLVLDIATVFISIAAIFLAVK